MKILIKPRIHISLISMHDGGYRMNGGVGLSIDEPRGVLNFRASKKFVFTDKRNAPFSDTEQEQLLTVLSDVKKALRFENSLNIDLDGGMLTHFGMGSGTAIRLACIEALLLLNGRKVTKEDLIALSKRGGTSGIGIHTYFSGQFVIDLGVKKSGKLFGPSSKADSHQRPLLLDAINFPNWKIGLCIPSNIVPKTQSEETDFFHRICPISAEESYRTLYHSLYGTYAAVRENDMKSFARSIMEIQSCEWKCLEREEYSRELTRLEERLYQCGAACVGMSSLGPLLYFLAPDDEYLTILDNMVGQDCDLIITNASNSGREIVI